MIIPRQIPNVAAAVDCVPTIIVCAVMVSLAWIAILLRLWTKVRIVKTTGWDDWIMLIATVFFTVYCGSVIDISTRVTATHQIVSFNDLLISVNLLNVAEVFYVLSMMALKISLSVFFLRLTAELWQRRVVLVALAVSCTYSVVMFFFVVFQCGVYNNTTTFILRRLGDQCASNSFTLGMTYTHAVISTLTDWTFLVLPIFILKGSLMNKNEKRTVGLILMFASVGGIASIIRFKFILGLVVPKDEFFANASNIGIWSCIEPGIGIIAGSMITLRPLVRRLVILFKNLGSYSGSKFPRRRSPPVLHRTPSSVHLQQPQHDPERAFLAHQASVQEMGIIEEKAVIETGPWVRPPVAKKRSSGLPLNLFGSMKSKSSSKRTKSTKSSTSRFSTFSIAPTIPDMPSFIWRETTDETDDGSQKGSEHDDEKDSKRGDPGMRPSPTWLERSEEDWLEEQLSLEQRSPTVDEHDRRFSQISSVPSPRFPPSLAGTHSPRWHQHYESTSNQGIPETPPVPLSPMFPEGHIWHPALGSSQSRASTRPSTSYLESARIQIGLEMDPQPQTPTRIWHQRQGSENSIMQARIESIPQNPASHYQGRTSEDSLRWPSTHASALQEETLRINQETFPPRISSRIFPQRRSSRMPPPQDNAVRFQPYRAESSRPDISPPITPRRFWQQKPLPRPPPVVRKPVPGKSILKKPVPPPMSTEPTTPRRKEKKSRSSGLPLDIFFGSSHASSSSKSSL